MMDPLSLTASIIAVLQLTSTLTSFLNDIQNATEEQQTVAIEAANIHIVLMRLRYRVESASSTDNHWLDQVRSLDCAEGPLDQLKASLEELVSLLPPTQSERKRDRFTSSLRWPWKKDQVETLLQRIERLKTLIHYILTDDLLSLTEATHGQVKSLSAGISNLELNAEQQLLRSAISAWLSAPDPSINYNAALRRKHPATGTWLLKHPSFQIWKNPETPSIIWLYGNAGCGKTILCSSLLQDVMESCKQVEEESLICYFYFDFKDTGKQHSFDLLRSLTRQCLDQVKDPSLLERIYSITCRSGRLQPSDSMLQSFVQTCIASQTHTYIIVDALDECKESASMLSLLDEIKTWPRTSIAITSRWRKDIEDHFRCADYKINIESSLVSADIEIYTHYRVTTDARLRKWSSKDQEEIISSLTLKSGGMFQWVFCQIEALAKCIKLASLRKTMNTLPKTLDDVYTRMLHDIEAAENIDDATTVLQWLCFSKRPLQVSELVEVLAIQPGEIRRFDPDERLSDPGDIQTICSNLIIYRDSMVSEDMHALDIDYSDNSSQHLDIDISDIRLSHFSVAEYLLSDRCVLQPSFVPSNCHAKIGESCLIYLLHVVELEMFDSNIAQHFPLINYAAQCWFEHLQNLDSIPDSTLQLAYKLLCSESSLLAWVQLCGRSFFWSGYLARNDFDLTVSDLYHALAYAASTGLPDLVRMLLSNDGSNGLKGDHHTNVLLLGASSGSTTIVQILLDAGWNIHATTKSTSDNHQGPALIEAAASGKLQVVELLLSAGANINCSRGTLGHENALCAATSHGHEEVVRLLLSRGVNDKVRSKALYAAIHRDELLKMILDAGVEDVDAVIDCPRHFFRQTPLNQAVSYQYVSVVQMLVRHGANVNVSDDRGQSILTTAIKRGNLEIVQILLKAGAKYSDEDGNTQLDHFLLIAAKFGHSALFPVLLDLCSNAHLESRLYAPALSVAALNNHQSMVEGLLSIQANPQIIYGKYHNPLQAAVIDGEYDSAVYGGRFRSKAIPKAVLVVLECQQFVIDLAIGPHEQSESTGSVDPISLKYCGGFDQEKILALFDWQITLEHYMRHQTACKQLIVELNKKSRYKLPRTLLSLLRSGSRWRSPPHDEETLLQILLDLGGRYSEDLLCRLGRNLYSGPARLHVVQSLLEAGADVNAIGGYYGTALQGASRNGRLDIVSLMLEHGALVNGNEGIFANSLQAGCATIQENLPLVRMLIDAGADVNASGGLFGTALQAASYRGFKNVVRLLLSEGADVNIQAGRYGTALHAACASPASDVELVKLLLDAGADPDVVAGIFGTVRGAILSKQYRPVYPLPKDDHASSESVSDSGSESSVE